jgi:hypothetical protein
MGWIIALVIVALVFFLGDRRLQPPDLAAQPV